MSNDIVIRLNVGLNQVTYDALVRVMKKNNWASKSQAVRECIEAIDWQTTDKKLSATPEAIERWQRSRS